jgi:hypothetical protein
MNVTKVTPGDVIHASRDNPALHACIMAWQQGTLTWDEAMMTAAVHLAKQNAELIDNELHRMQREPPRPIVVENAQYAPIR